MVYSSSGDDSGVTPSKGKGKGKGKGKAKAKVSVRTESGSDVGGGEGHSSANSDVADQLRQLTRDALDESMPETAAFYADKLVTFSQFAREDVLLLAKAYYACGLYLRVVQLLGQHRLLDFEDRFGLRACHLAALSLHAADKVEDCVVLLEKVLGYPDSDAELVKAKSESMKEYTSIPTTSNSSRTTATTPAPGHQNPKHQLDGIEVMAWLCCLRGKAYALLDNRSRAVVWLRAALEVDVRCVEALRTLLK
ncbi:unnamed protein product [Choristocarpus tenellus]